jgi:cytochrome d ubiquinol oxidase subunit II
MNVVAFALLAAMLVTYALLDGYDLGVGAVVRLFARSDDERGAAIASIGPFWNGNEVWLIAASGVLFAFFPRAYASSLSGFYLPLMVMLWLLMFRGIALELRGHYAGRLWHDFWDWAFSLSSAALALILGVALGNLLRGLPLDAHGNFSGTFSLLLNPYALAVGAFSLIVLAQHGWCFLRMSLPQAPARSNLGRGLWLAALTLEVVVTAWTFAAHPLGGPKFIVAGILGCVAFLALLAVDFLERQRKVVAAFAASSACIATLLGAAVAMLYPYLIPSSSSAPGLTIFDAAPSGEALVGIVVIVVIGLITVYSYLILVLRRMFTTAVEDNGRFGKVPDVGSVATFKRDT